MNTCKTCKHWKASTDDDNYPYYDEITTPIDPDTYQPMQMPFEVRNCRHPAQTFCERPVEANGFGVADGSQYMARLFTGPYFGCVRHES